MTCPSCKQKIPEDALSCPSCHFSFGDQTQRFAAREADGTRLREARPTSSPSYNSIDNAQFVPGMILASRYRIVGLLGKGGMGEVYRADDLKLTQPVALKFLPDHLMTDGAALARFHREVRIARQVSHNNVCRVYDIGEIDGRHFLSMEFIKGEELSSLLRRIGRLPSDKAKEISRQLCAGLAAAHKQNVLHRDLKPANVMIDDNGNVRLTDFGIAGLVEELGTDDARAGTPAYMSPEQLSGGELTVKSDIYSLGLVIYEIFTGKKAFDAPTIPQLLNLRQGDATPTNPSTLVQNLDPLVERIILRCIEKDPEKRPASALEVAASLPGGDPLAAALAAGETPSPEMVAAAPKEGLLKPAIAFSLLAGILLLIGAVVVLSEKTQLHRRVALEKSPEALQERARTILARFGYTDPPVDSTYGLGADTGYLFYAERRNPSLLRELSNSQPASLYFWYRHSPSNLMPRGHMVVRASLYDPPPTYPGMATVALDPKGRLIEFLAVPPEFDEGAQPAAPFDWAVMFEAAGLSQPEFTPAKSEWVPPINSDTRVAWEGKLPNQTQLPIRLEAASYAGKPVFFKIVGPWNSPEPLGQPQSKSVIGKMIEVVLVAAIIAFFAIGVVLGRRNLRDGSGDQKGGSRLAAYMFLALMASWVFRAHHYGFNQDLGLLQIGIQFALLPAIFIWLFYLALEPYVRRWWPHRMVSWSRLLAGDFRDPLIGRDILVGAAFGIAIVFVARLWTLTPGWLGRPQVPSVGRLYTLLSVREMVGEFFFTGVTQMVFLGVACLLGLLLLHIIFRRKEWLAIGVAWLLLTVSASLGGRGTLLISSIYAAIFAALLIAVATRFGLLAVTTALFFISFFGNCPMTTDFGAWYAPSTIFVLVVTLVLVAYAFYIALAGRKVFKGRLMPE